MNRRDYVLTLYIIMVRLIFKYFVHYTWTTSCVIHYYIHDTLFECYIITKTSMDYWFPFIKVKYCIVNIKKLNVFIPFQNIEISTLYKIINMSWPNLPVLDV